MLTKWLSHLCPGTSLNREQMQTSFWPLNPNNLPRQMCTESTRLGPGYRHRIRIRPTWRQAWCRVLPIWPHHFLDYYSCKTASFGGNCVSICCLAKATLLPVLAGRGWKGNKDRPASMQSEPFCLLCIFSYCVCSWFDWCKGDQQLLKFIHSWDNVSFVKFSSLAKSPSACKLSSGTAKGLAIWCRFPETYLMQFPPKCRSKLASF